MGLEIPRLFKVSVGFLFPILWTWVFFLPWCIWFSPYKRESFRNVMLPHKGCCLGYTNC